MNCSINVYKAKGTNIREITLKSNLILENNLYFEIIVIFHVFIPCTDTIVNSKHEPHITTGQKQLKLILQNISYSRHECLVQL